MLNGWQKAYQELKDFITANPGIEVKQNVTSIPGEVRPEFYRLFDTVRVAFLEEKFRTSQDEAKSLSDNYIKVEQEIVELLKLGNTSTSPSLHSFLHDPKDRLIPGQIFDLLFDLLREKIDTEAFLKESSKDIEVTFRELFKLGYEKWITLSIVKLLAPDKAFGVSVPQPDLFDGNPIPREEQVPKPEELKNLSFERPKFYSFIVPDLIVHSPKINQYVAFRTEFGHAWFTASGAGQKRERYSLNPVRLNYGFTTLNPSLLIYLDENVEELSLIADINNIYRPDLIVECKEQKDWYGKEKLEKVKQQHDILKPKLGTYIVSREPVPEQSYTELAPSYTSQEVVSEQTYQKELPYPAPPEPPPEQRAETQNDAIHILNVGFDQFKLEPIIEVMKNLKKPE